MTRKSEPLDMPDELAKEFEDFRVQMVMRAWRQRFPSNMYAWPGAPEDFAREAVRALKDHIL